MSSIEMPIGLFSMRLRSFFVREKTQSRILPQKPRGGHCGQKKPAFIHQMDSHQPESEHLQQGNRTDGDAFARQHG
ncbi:MAG: hypothetical protein AB7S56_06090 [Halothiobacillaceae bacterium]